MVNAFGKMSVGGCASAFWTVALICTAVQGDPLTNITLPHAHRLFNDLFRHYRREIRPVSNDKYPVNVTLHLWFKQVLKVDEIDQILTIYCWVEEYWNDDFLSWDPAAYGGVEVLHVPADKIWRPDIMVYNNADMNIQENELTTNAVLNYTGNIMCFRAMITKITCDLDMTYFPFDKQNCSMMLASWSSDGSKVTVAPKYSTDNLIYYIENTEWKLLDFRYRRNQQFYDCCPEPYTDVTYYFNLERNPSYYILNLIIPSVFITVVTMVGFFTPYSSTGENTEKVSLGVTALLSLAIILLMVADKMPATSKVIPLIGKYYIGLIWLIFAATIITTVTLRLQSKGNAGKPLSADTKRLFFNYIAKFLFMKLDLPSKPHYTRYQNYHQPDERVSSTEPESTVEINGGIGMYAKLKSNSNAKGNTSKTPSPIQMRRLDPFLLGESRAMHETALTSAQTSKRNNDGSGSPVWRRQPSTPSPKETDRVTNALRDTFLTVSESLSNVDARLHWQMGYERVQQEWGQLARVVERLLMIIFIIGTILFAALVTVLAVPLPFVTFWG